jgi:hypothetical protein
MDFALQSSPNAFSEALLELLATFRSPEQKQPGMGGGFRIFAPES